MTRQKLTAYMESILPADRDAMDAARRRQAELALSLITHLTLPTILLV